MVLSYPSRLMAILCLDEAYIELAPPGTGPTFGISNRNVIRFRTFSKAYGMAGARVGYGIAHEELAKHEALDAGRGSQRDHADAAVFWESCQLRS